MLYALQVPVVEIHIPMRAAQKYRDVVVVGAQGRRTDAAVSLRVHQLLRKTELLLRVYRVVQFNQSHMAQFIVETQSQRKGGVGFGAKVQVIRKCL